MLTSVNSYSQRHRLMVRYYRISYFNSVVPGVNVSGSSVIASSSADGSVGGYEQTVSTEKDNDSGFFSRRTFKANIKISI